MYASGKVAESTANAVLHNAVALSSEHYGFLGLCFVPTLTSVACSFFKKEEPKKSCCAGKGKH